MLDRRRFLHGAACAGAGGLLPLGAGAAFSREEAEDGSFFCETQQITELDGLDLLGNTPGEEEDDELSLPGGASDEDIDLYAVARRATRWKRSDGVPNSDGLIILKIGFIDGEDWQHGAVKEHASEWLRHGMPLDFVYSQDRPHIRISFTRSNKSEYGRNALNIGASSATMLLKDCQRQNATGKVRRVVIHEFGHGVMTLGHEHKHPGADFRWREDEIVRDTGWSLNDVRVNITSVYGREMICNAAAGYDVKSIMHYPIKPNWVENSQTIPLNTTLSASDVACAKSVYP